MENKDLQQYIVDVQHFSNALKFFHWQTKIYAKHMNMIKKYSVTLISSFFVLN